MCKDLVEKQERFREISPNCYPYFPSQAFPLVGPAISICTGPKKKKQKKTSGFHLEISLFKFLNQTRSTSNLY